MDIICSEKRTVFREHSSRETELRGTDNVQAQISEHIVFIILQIFFATHEVLKIGEYSWIFPSFSWGIFGHVMCLDQSRASENI